MKWFCSSSLCFNNFNSKKSNGESLNYYRLPRDPDLQRQYRAILRSDRLNWEKGHLCGEHWSSGVRASSSDLPDVPVPHSQLLKIEEKYKKAKARVSPSNPNPVAMKKARELKVKLSLAKQLASSAHCSTPSTTKIDVIREVQ